MKEAPELHVVEEGQDAVSSKPLAAPVEWGRQQRTEDHGREKVENDFAKLLQSERSFSK